MEVQISPTENRTEHVKTYLEPSVVEAIREFQKRYSLSSFSFAVRDLILMGLHRVPSKIALDEPVSSKAISSKTAPTSGGSLE